MAQAIPAKNPRFRSLRWNDLDVKRERMVRQFVATSLRPPFFSEIRRLTGIPDKQLSRTLNSLYEKGYQPVLRWVDLRAPHSSRVSTTPRDVGHIGFPEGSSGRLWAIELIDLIKERPRTRREILGKCRNRITAGRRLNVLIEEGALSYRTRKTGRRGRPCRVLVLRGESDG